MEEFKKAYRVLEVPYVRFDGFNNDEIIEFLHQASMRVADGGYSLRQSHDREGWHYYLVTFPQRTEEEIKPGDYLVWIDDVVYVESPSYFKKHWRVTKPVFRKGGKR